VSLTLRPYQLALLDQVRAAMRGGAHAPLVVAPTGSGKTVMFAEIARSAAAKGNRVLILVHRREILEQTLSKLHALGITSGQIASGRPMTMDTVQSAMIQTLVRRLAYVRRPDIIIADECHHVLPDNSHGRALAYWREVPRIGWTATPERLDGRGLGATFDRLILGPSTAELVAQGFLSPPVVYRPPNEVSTRYHVKRGDFDTAEQQRTMSARTIVGDVIAHYRRHFDGAPAICFCVSVEHTKLMAVQFSAAGYRAEPVYGDMPDAERDRALRGLASGDVQVITSCDLISEGFDTPAVAGCILLRRTMSLGLYLQQVGRALRPFPGKTRAIVLDHVGNYYLHGHVLADREWSLDSGRRDPKQRPPTTSTCPKCYAILPGTPLKCPYCGYALAEREERKVKPMKVLEGELIEAGVPESEAAQVAAFAAATQGMEPKQRASAMLGRAFAYAADGDVGRRRLDALRKALGYGRGWTGWAWDYAQKKRRAG